MKFIDKFITEIFVNNESQLERYFRTEYFRDYQSLNRMNVKPSDDLIISIIEGQKT